MGIRTLFLVLPIVAVAGCEPVFKPLPPEVAARISLNEVQISASETVSSVFRRSANPEEVRQAFERGIRAAFKDRKGDIPINLEVKVVSVKLPTAASSVVAAAPTGPIGFGSNASEATMEVTVTSEDGKVLLPVQTLTVDSFELPDLIIGSGVRLSRAEQIEKLGEAVGAKVLENLTTESRAIGVSF